MPTEMVPMTLELARGRLVAFSVLAIAASVVFGVALYNAIEHPSFWHQKLSLRAEITLRNLHRLADHGFPRWRVAHPLDRCPRTIEDLAAYADADIRGPYAGEATYVFTCDAARMPPGVYGIWIRDLGADELLGTDDDYTSDMDFAE
ncbi:MAG TPA: hypothetical protein VFQ65_34225 [Kofleriaceae bacterium]|nr:hypothetical protein [Kofleriaceae bacterium]